ncbi:auxilin-like clathrin uncoating factor Swa2p [Trichomonascus vanleenenianus]|uniref:auxilin-like protein SWA2 n=1 Tax=Trichomonascus vanleenenianus TaxID=2268995 RepID=UPI003ECB658D
MDPFSDLLKPSSTTNSSRTSTPLSGARSQGKPGNDSFADLASLAGLGTNKTKSLAQMSLKEREEYARRNGSQSSNRSRTGTPVESSTVNSWSGLDLLGGGISNSGSTTGSTQGTGAQPGGNPQASDSIDDLFDVFNRPPEPKKESPPPKSPSPEIPAKFASPEPINEPINEDRHSPREPVKPREDPRDEPIAELVDMGFSVEQARQALANTDNGLDVAQAIDFIMREAHERSRPASRGSEPPSRGSSSSKLENISTQDIGKMAQQFSATFISKANVFWSQGRKNVAKAIEQYQSSQSHNDGTPAWMRDAERYKAASFERRRPAHEVATEEASALEASLPPKPPRRRPQAPIERESPPPEFSRRSEPPAMPQRPQKQSSRPSTPSGPSPPSGLSTPSGRSTPSGMSRAQQFKMNNADGDMPMYSSRRRTPVSAPSTPSQRPSTPKPKRQPVPISSTALDMATASRNSGNDAFKTGDYTTAAEHYGRALESIPPKHLLRPVLLSNRAACLYKLGDVKGALRDADEGILIIGSGMGDNEEVEPGKPLKEIWVKLIVKRAESYEQMEKFKESIEAWTLAINNGYANKNTMDARRRCQAHLDPTPKKTTPAPSRPASSASSKGPTSKAGKEAVDRIRQVNEQAAKSETEKFVLYDSVQTKIDAWRRGKEDNLRGLLASLDNVLWPEMQWKTVSMADLVLPKKVKIAYMKAVAKTHPDKISDSATTEQKMIANAVFITLNSAWDGFKSSNGLS